MSNTERLCGTSPRIPEMSLMAKSLVGCIGDIIAYANHIDDIPNRGKQNIKYLFKIASIPYLFRIGLGLGRDVFKNNRGMGIFAAAATYYETVSVWDDMTDASIKRKETLTVQELEEAGKDLVTKIVDLVKASPATEDQKSAFLNDFRAFQMEEYQLYLDYQNRGGVPMNFEETKKYKEATLIPNIVTGLKLCLLFIPPLNQEKFIRAQNAVIAANLALQVADDVNDYRIDEEEGADSFMSAAINQFPEEKTELNARLQLGYDKIIGLREFAPKTFALLDETALGYLNQIPPEQDNLKTSARALFKLLYTKIKPAKISNQPITG